MERKRLLSVFISDGLGVVVVIRSVKLMIYRSEEHTSELQSPT